MPYDEVATVMNAVGNHEEDASDPATAAAAAVVIADKADVHETRVRLLDPSAYDIHDRVNHSAKRSFLRVDSETRMLTLEIEIDTSEIQIMEYFEIFSGTDAVEPSCRYSVGRGVLARNQRNKAPLAEEMTDQARKAGEWTRSNATTCCSRSARSW